VIENAVPFPSWESFYVIVGSSAGALTGLQFVVMALIADSKRRPTAAVISAYGSPTIVHFCVVLLLSAVLSAPWPSLVGPDWVLGVAGLIGVVYAIIITLRTTSQDNYKPVFEDWLFHNILPFVAYALLLSAAIILRSHTTAALFMVATMTLILLFVGIHNAWDTVTFIVVGDGQQKPSVSAADSSTPMRPAEGS
jgi:hypothetical protein